MEKWDMRRKWYMPYRMWGKMGGRCGRWYRMREKWRRLVVNGTWGKEGRGGGPQSAEDEKTRVFFFFVVVVANIFSPFASCFSANKGKNEATPELVNPSYVEPSA